MPTIHSNERTPLAKSAQDPSPSDAGSRFYDDWSYLIGISLAFFAVIGLIGSSALVKLPYSSGTTTTLRSSILVNDTIVAVVPTTDLNNIATTALDSSSLFTEDMANGFEGQRDNDSKNNGDPCSNGKNDECGNGLICGRYNDRDNYQCCACTHNDCVIQGQAWCRNVAGGTCSDGNDNNCGSGLVCGKNTHYYKYGWRTIQIDKYVCHDNTFDEYFNNEFNFK